MILRVGLTVALLTATMGCDSKSVADEYIKKQGASDAGPTSGETVIGEPDNGGPENGEPTGPEQKGDPEAGLELMKPCVACHNDSGLAKNTVLNAAVIPRLDQALTGDFKGNHGGFKDSFAGENRVNMEAALTLIK